MGRQRIKHASFNRSRGVEWCFVRMPVRDGSKQRIFRHCAGRRKAQACDRAVVEPFSWKPFRKRRNLHAEATLRRIHLPGYLTAIEAGVGTIMPSYSSWNGVKCSASKRLLTEILKNEMGFQGFLISDYNALDQISSDFKEGIGISINAGMDMVMVPDTYVEFINLLTQLVQDGRVPISRVDDAVTRIIRVKLALGLLEPAYDFHADRALEQRFGSAEHRAVARQAVRQSMVLLKNEHGALPLAKSARRIHVVGKSADDIGIQTGGG
jgi:beta-glucosidase